MVAVMTTVGILKEKNLPEGFWKLFYFGRGRMWPRSTGPHSDTLIFSFFELPPGLKHTGFLRDLERSRLRVKGIDLICRDHREAADGRGLEGTFRILSEPAAETFGRLEEPNILEKSPV